MMMSGGNILIFFPKDRGNRNCEAAYLLSPMEEGGGRPRATAVILSTICSYKIHTHI